MRLFEVKTSKKEEYVDVTAKVAEAVSEAGVKDGVCVVYCPHTTAGVTINENADPDVVHDLLLGLNDIVGDPGFRHAEGNSPAHLKALLTGESVTVPVNGGRLALGTWQGIYFTEYDGPRRRRLHVQVLGK